MIVIIVTGTRYPGRETKARVCKTLSDFRDRKDVVLIQGGADGADRYAKEYAQLMGWTVGGFEFVGALGKAGGQVRNEVMAVIGESMKLAEHDVFCFAFPVEGSKGTWSCCRCLKAHGLSVEVVR